MVSRADASFWSIIFTAEQLAEVYAAADVFVFPSRTDTFGLVLLEALASGVPVAAFPVTGARDVLGDAPVGFLSEDLRSACLVALEIAADACLEFAASLTWEKSAAAFVRNMVGDSRSCRQIGKSAARQPAFCCLICGREPCRVCRDLR